MSRDSLLPGAVPDLAAGGGSRSQQTAKIMVAFQALWHDARPDAVLVVGDVNSTLACCIVARKLNIPVAHVEAGLRCGYMSMPEEINRLVTDSVSDWLFVAEPSGVAHLQREGKAASATILCPAGTQFLPLQGGGQEGDGVGSWPAPTPRVLKPAPSRRRTPAVASATAWLRCTGRVMSIARR